MPPEVGTTTGIRYAGSVLIFGGRRQVGSFHQTPWHRTIRCLTLSLVLSKGCISVSGYLSSCITVPRQRADPSVRENKFDVVTISKGASHRLTNTDRAEENCHCQVTRIRVPGGRQQRVPELDQIVEAGRVDTPDRHCRASVQVTINGQVIPLPVQVQADDGGALLCASVAGRDRGM